MAKKVDKDVIGLFFPQHYNSNINYKTGKEYGWIPTRCDKPYYMTLRGAIDEAEYFKKKNSNARVRVMKKMFEVFNEEEIEIK